MSSLRRNLTFSLTAILVVVCACLWAVLSISIARVTQDQLLLHLEHDGDALLSALRIGDDGALDISDAAVESVYHQPRSGHYFIVASAEGRVLKSPSLEEGTLALDTVLSGQRASRRLPGPHGETVLVLARSVMVRDRVIQVVVGENLAAMNREITEQSITALLTILPILIAAVVLQHFFIGRALRPLAEVRNALHHLSRGDVSRIETPAPEEIRPLVDEVNRLLVVVDRRLTRSRTAIGNLAHALKAPLAMLFHVADDASLPAQARDALREHTQSIHARIESELKRARLAGNGPASGHFEPRAELDVMSRVLQSLYRDKALRINIDAPAGPLPFDREDMLELVGNLADNACKWANARVRIEVQPLANEPTVRFCVADDGPGCPDDVLGRLPGRGVRLDESRQGHGLGLSICAEIASFYGGTMAFSRDSRLGGLRVTIEIPLKPPIETGNPQR